jgi:hypothetical protein
VKNLSDCQILKIKETGLEILGKALKQVRKCMHSTLKSLQLECV